MSAGHGKSWTRGEVDNNEESIRAKVKMRDPAKPKGERKLLKRTPSGKNFHEVTSDPDPGHRPPMSDYSQMG